MGIDKANSIPTGSTVEVWNRSLGRFAGRFEVAGSTPEGVEVRRPSEQTPLPERFTPDEVRPVNGAPR